MTRCAARTSSSRPSGWAAWRAGRATSGSPWRTGSWARNRWAPAGGSRGGGRFRWRVGWLFGAEWLRAVGSIPNEYLHYYYCTREAVAAARAAQATRGEFLDRQQAAFFAEAASADPVGAYAAWERTRMEREETYMAES